MHICYAVHILMLSSVEILILYEIILKRIPLIGNIVISSLVGIVFVFIEAGLTNKIDTTYPIMILAFNLNLIREIIKDIQDLEGDKLYNMKTLPIILGKHKTIIFIILPYTHNFIIKVNHFWNIRGIRPSTNDK